MGSPAINGFQKNRLKLPFSPDLVLMEGGTKFKSAWQTAAGGATGYEEFPPYIWK